MRRRMVCGNEGIAVWRWGAVLEEAFMIMVLSQICKE